MAEESEELKVFISHRESKCEECKSELGKNAWISLADEKGALCLSCAELDHLAFLPSGDAALTRRAKKYSKRFAVVLKWSRSRKRYERQGLLVEEEAIEKAEQECLSDTDIRERRREREALKREESDRVYVEQFTARIRELYPGCPKDREVTIAEHACRKYSGRIGRSAMAKELDAKAVELAVVAHIRHQMTNYDELLAAGYERFEAREEVLGQVERILLKWESGK